MDIDGPGPQPNDSRTKYVYHLRKKNGKGSGELTPKVHK
jgi:hypothetical protein